MKGGFTAVVMAALLAPCREDERSDPRVEPRPCRQSQRWIGVRV